MFNFVFNNQLGFLLAFLPALMNLALVFYIYFRLPANRMTNVFAVFTLALCFWQLTDSVLRICPDGVIAGNWDVILCASWIFTGPLCLHFALLYCNMLKARFSRMAMFLLYGPAVVFTLIYSSRAYPHPFMYDKIWGWYNYHENFWIDELIINWVSLCVVSSAILVFCKGLLIKNDRQHRLQTFIIATGIAIPTIVGIAGEVIRPMLLNKPAIPLTSSFLTFFTFATVLSLNRYRLFNAADMVSNEALINDLPVMIFTISERRRVTYINKFAADILGVPPHETGVLSMKQLLRYIPDQHEQAFQKAFNASLKGEQADHVESGFMTSTGLIDVIISAKPVINNNKIQGVLFAARDITELKASHELMKHKELLLEDAQQIAHIGSFEWDTKSNVVTCSDEMYRIYGFAPGEYLNSFESFVERTSPAERHHIKEKLLEAYLKNEPFTIYAHAEKKDGSAVMIHSRGKISVDENNNVKLNGTVQDVTEEKNKENKLKNQNDELIKINHELDKFVYSVSHDLRAPLLSMQGVVEITAEDTLEEHTLSHMNMLKSSINKLDDFINEILDYSRNARTELKVEQINFKDLLSEITGALKFMDSTGRPVQLSVEAGEHSIFYSDRSRLNVILSNLVSNAIRYQNPKAASAEINVRIYSDANHAYLEIRDNGIGIPKKYHEKIFEMFYRVSEKSSGSGLGLYIVKEAVTRLNGTITVDSVQEKGTTFYLKLPNLFFQ